MGHPVDEPKWWEWTSYSNLRIMVHGIWDDVGYQGYQGLHQIGEAGAGLVVLGISRVKTESERQACDILSEISLKVFDCPSKDLGKLIAGCKARLQSITERAELVPAEREGLQQCVAKLQAIYDGFPTRFKT